MTPTQGSVGGLCVPASETIAWLLALKITVRPVASRVPTRDDSP
jgi:hypothetical protein